MHEYNEKLSMRKIKKELIKECGPYCWCCGKAFEPNVLQGHHVTPQSQNGLTIVENIAILCAKCHKEKHELIQQGNWLRYHKAMRKIVYRGNLLRKNYQEFISETKK